MSKPKPASNTHYWCEFCNKFIKNTSIDRKSHENGLPHQEAKAKKIESLRSGSEQKNLDAQIAALEAAANKSVARDGTGFTAYGSEYSTYTPTPPVHPLVKLPLAHPIAAAPPQAPPRTQASVASPNSQPVANEASEKSKEAHMPGAWETVEEETTYNSKYRKLAHADEETESTKTNTKKRERYGEDESALEQMEAESRIMSTTSRVERVPEQYRSDVLGGQIEEPGFKPKQPKGGNVKKRVKQL